MVQMNNIRRLIVLYWRHSTEDRENSWTKELYEALIYEDNLRPQYHRDTEFIIANTNRKTESYFANREIVEYLRPKKLRGEPLIYLDLVFPNEKGSKEEFISIDSKYNLEQAIARIDYYLNHFQK